MAKVYLCLPLEKGEVCSLLRLLSVLLPKMRQFQAAVVRFHLPFSNGSLSLFSKWKDPNFFGFSTSSQKMTAHLSDGTENCVGVY